MNRRRFVQSSIAATVAASLPSKSALAAAWHALTAVTSDVNAITGDGAEVTLKQTAVKELGDSIRGRLLMPGGEAYETARQVLNPSIDKHPALIAQCAGSADVRHAVQFARESKLLVSVKCGGHSYAGKATCDGGLMIDLTTLRGVRVDPLARTARVEGGSLLGDMDHDTMAYGLVTTAGTVSHTGVGGLTLGGGFGRLARRFGLTLDNLLTVDIITADGEFRRASADENPDLFWGVRGGGGNFGVVTSFEFRLHPMQREVVAGAFLYPMSEAKQVLNFFGEWADGLPDEIGVQAGVMNSPGSDSMVLINVVHSGEAGDAEALIAPCRKAGTVLKETVRSWDYVALQKSGDIDDPRANGSYMKSGFTGVITPQLVDEIVDNFQTDPGRATRLFFHQTDGAIGRVPTEATAFAHRHAKHNMLCFVAWPMGNDPAEHVKYIKRYWAGLQRHTTGFYVNDMFEETQKMVNANYLGNYDRLVRVKNTYDPTNLFRLNANVVPTVS